MQRPTVQDRITQLEAQLAAAQQELQNFTYAVSHDLRAPLRHIVSYAHIVQDEAGPQLDPEQREFLATITDSAKHLGRMLDGLLELSRIGTMPVQLESVSLQALVQEVVNQLTLQHPQRQISWRVASHLPSVWADVALLRKVLEQVLDNAVKFTAPSDNAEITITATPAPSPDRVLLTIQDNGIGYDPAQQSKLFQAFGRLHASQKFSGLGMGLVLARKAMHHTNGVIGITGTAGEGCRVTLSMLQA